METLHLLCDIVVLICKCTYFSTNSIGFINFFLPPPHPSPPTTFTSPQWVPSGQAFRINDISRLEKETLPSYFRHSRFQSLVRQLNFYNFRKVNRERTFWVYYHPLFHRDQEENLHNLRRRTCPGVDGRISKRNGGPNLDRDGFASPSLYEGSVSASSGGVDMMVSTRAGAKVSRSPSPSSSYSADSYRQPVGRGSVRSAPLQSMVSEEESSPMEEKTSFHRSVSSGDSSSFAAIDRTIRSTYVLRDVSNNNEYHEENISDADNEVQENRDHMDVVAEVSRDLNEICYDLNSTQKPRGRGGRGLGGDVYAFGFEKPEKHYSQIKCDLFTYDYEDCFVAEEAEEIARSQKVDTAVKSNVTKARRTSLVQAEATEVAERVDLSPPTHDNAVILSLTTSCKDGTLVNSTSNTTNRCTASSVLEFCLSNHLEDVALGTKIVTHLRNNPTLGDEFEAYRKALDRGGALYNASLEDLKRDWKTFSLNYIHDLLLAVRHHTGDTSDKVTSGGVELSPDEREAIRRCSEVWF